MKNRQAWAQAGRQRIREQITECEDRAELARCRQVKYAWEKFRLELKALLEVDA